MAPGCRRRSRVVVVRVPCSPDMAIRLEKAGWSKADHWLRLQMAFELAEARRHEDRIHVQPYRAAPGEAQGRANC